MKLCISSYLLFIALCIHGAAAATVRKQPAFATPIYTDSYLPASMQVILYIVEQMKNMGADEVETKFLSTSATSPHPPGQKQPLPTTPSTIDTVDEIQTSTETDEEKYYIPPEKYQEEALIISKPDNADSGKISSQITPEVDHEESEVVYGVPEKNYEIPERNHEVPEAAQASQESEPYVPSGGNEEGEKSQDEKNTCNDLKKKSEQAASDATTSSAVDSVVKEIYTIIKTSSLDEKPGSSSSGGQTVPEDCIESKNSPMNIEAEKLPEDKERTDELKDDNRFTLLGERVDQVPRPSLLAFLKASNATSNPTIQILAQLYDALSKDARRQGFSKYAGYSDTVLKSLQDTHGGGAGVQLKELLEKTEKNKELTRFDAMEKTKDTIALLSDDGSELSTILRLKLPFRFRA